MPIIERTPQGCFEVFTAHMRELVAATITSRYPLSGIATADGTRLTLSFREISPVAVPIDTAYGRLFFYLGQALEAVPEGRAFRLKTRQYWYRLQHGPDLSSKAAIRWEYDRTTPRDRHCRNHAQAAAQLPFGEGTLDLDRVHLPTGWVTIEEVIRFLIHELGMQPPCGDEWWERVITSESRFFAEFSGKGYVPDSN